MEIQKKYRIKVPDNISVFYCSQKKIVVFSTDLAKTSLKLKVQIFFSKKGNIIKVSSLPFDNLSTKEKKNLKSMQGTTCALIKQKLIETTSVLYKKKTLVLKSIYYNVNFFNLTRWKANTSFSFLPRRSSQTFVSNRCVNTINKKKFNKLTNFSRMVFLKLARSRKISNVYRSSW